MPTPWNQICTIQKNPDSLPHGRTECSLFLYSACFETNYLQSNFSFFICFSSVKLLVQSHYLARLFKNVFIHHFKPQKMFSSSSPWLFVTWHKPWCYLALALCGCWLSWSYVDPAESLPHIRFPLHAMYWPTTISPRR